MALERVRQSLLHLILSALVVSCAPWGGRGEKDRAKEQYRLVNRNCKELKLSASELDAPTFRSLLGCMNSQHGLEPIASLVDKISDAEIAPLLSTFNQLVMNDRQRLYEIVRTTELAADSGKFEPSLVDLGKIIDDGKWLTRFLGVVRKYYFKSEQNQARVLSALEKWGAQIEVGGVSNRLDSLILLMRSKAGNSILEGLRVNSDSMSTPMSVAASSYFRNTKSLVLDPIRDTLVALSKPNGFELMGEVLGNSSESIQKKLPGLLELFEAMSDPNFSAPLGDLFLKMSEPTSCANGALEVPDGGLLGALREIGRLPPGGLRNFVSRTKPLQTVMVSSLCTMPPELRQHYDAVIRLAYSSMDSTIESISKAALNAGQEEWLFHLLQRLRDLQPVFLAAKNAKIADDFFLLLAASDAKAQGTIQSDSQFLLDSGAYDLLSDIISESSAMDLALLLKDSLKIFSQPRLLSSALGQFRSLYYVSNASPFGAIAQKGLSESRSRRAALEAFLKISELPEFLDSLAHFSKMSGDGRTRDLALSLTKLFKPMATAGKTRDVLATREPELTRTLVHALSARDLSLKTAVFETWSPTDPCLSMQFSIPIDEYMSDGYETQWRNYLGCLARDRSTQAWAESLDWLSSNSLKDNRSGLSLMMDTIHRFKLSAASSAVVAQKLFSTIDDQYIHRALESVVQAREIFNPLLSMMNRIFVDSTQSFQKISSSIARIVELPEFAPSLRFLDKIEDTKELSDPKIPGPEVDPLLANRVRRELKNWECRETSSDPSLLVAQTIDDYRFAITNWEGSRGAMRRNWSYSEFKKQVEPLIKKMGNPVQEGFVLRSLIRVLGYFTLPQGVTSIDQVRHYPPDYLGQWLSERSKDDKLILYYFPGESETQPRVRVVNTLDRLELVLINADFNLVLPDNFGLKFLAEIGEAWGDEPKAVWPDWIKEKYSHGAKPPRLRDAYLSILDFLKMAEALGGYPAYNFCSGAGTSEIEVPKWGYGLRAPLPLEIKKKIFNLRQVVSVIEENLENGGMKVLRDLFYQLHESSPSEFRNPGAGFANNLSVVTRLVRMGLLREVSRKLREMPTLSLKFAPTGDPNLDLKTLAMRDMFRGLIAGSQAPSGQELLDEIFVRDRHQRLIWESLRAIFTTVDRSEQHAEAIKQLGLYTLAELSRSGATPVLVHSAVSVLKNHGSWIRSKSDWMEDMLGSIDLSRRIRVLFEQATLSGGQVDFEVLIRIAGQDQDPWQSLVQIAKNIDLDQAASGYRDILSQKFGDLRPMPMKRDLLRTISEDSPLGAELRAGLAQAVRADLVPWVELLARDSQGASRWVEAGLHHVEVGDADHWINLLRNNLRLK